MPRHILFPYDFSPQGREVARFVRALGVRSGARVTLFSVVPPTFESVPSEMGGLNLRAGDDAAVWRQRLQNRLGEAFDRELAGLGVDRVADGGDPALRITAFAHSHGVDLIMMPSHGVGTFRRLLVGSVTSKVLHDAKCPVWTAAHAETQTAADVPRMMLCAVDGSETTLAVVRYAMEFASLAGARLDLLHVVGPISDWPTLESERRLQEQVREDARQRITSLLQKAGVDVSLRVEVGGIVETVTEDARREQADLVIIGRGSVTDPFGRLRTHAFGIIQRSPCPVLSI
jgi:nucleotide-binding universal stress UspA family protein